MLFLLRKLIKEELTSKVPVAKNLELAAINFSRDEDDDFYVFLYDPKILLQIAHFSSDTGENLLDSYKEKRDFLPPLVYASVIYGKEKYMSPKAICNRAKFIKQSVSLPDTGLGPAAYDIAMWYASKSGGGLASDRGYVSKAATSVWQKYLKRSDVEIKDFDNVRKPKTPPPEDDCAVHNDKDIDFSAKLMKKPSGLQALESNHKKAIKYISEMYLVFEDDVIDTLSYAGNNLFRKEF